MTIQEVLLLGLATTMMVPVKWHQTLYNGVFVNAQSMNNPASNFFKGSIQKIGKDWYWGCLGGLFLLHKVVFGVIIQEVRLNVATILKNGIIYYFMTL